MSHAAAKVAFLEFNKSQSLCILKFKPPPSLALKPLGENRLSKGPTEISAFVMYTTNCVRNVMISNTNTKNGAEVASIGDNAVELPAGTDDAEVRK